MSIQGPAKERKIVANAQKMASRKLQSHHRLSIQKGRKSDTFVAYLIVFQL
jgi:hypothetical protein